MNSNKHRDRTQLTEREAYLWSLHCQGLTHKQIAQIAQISAGTVSTRIRSVKSRLYAKEQMAAKDEDKKESSLTRKEMLFSSNPWED